MQDALVENKENNTAWYNNMISIFDETQFNCEQLLSKDNCKDDTTYK